VIGAFAAVLGAAAGLMAWLIAASSLEGVVGHRIDAFDVPWWLVVSSMLLAVASAIGAAWWPARAVARTPIVSALSGRPDRPKATSRSVAVAGVLLAAGTGCLLLAGDPLKSWVNVLLILGGTIALIVGVLFVSPLAIRALARFRARAPVAVRLALGDLARYQSRSSAALAAISLALGIATAVVVTASSAMYGAASEGNLSDRQLMIRIGEIPGWDDIAPVAERTPAEVDRLDAQVDQIAASLDATVVQIDVALAPGFDGFEGVPSVVLGEEIEVDEGTAHRILTHLYVASAALLEHYKIDLEAVEQGTEVLTVETGELWYQPETERVLNAQRLPPRYSSLPGSFITPEALDRRGWQTVRAGWLVESSTPITQEQFAELRETAAAAGVTVEVRHDQANLATLRTVATTVGLLVALGVMAMTVGLIRSEATGDLRVLSAAGATSSNRRTLTAATAGGLALLGALLGIAGAYLALGAAHIRDLSALTPVPLLHLAGIGIGLSLVAAAAGWLLAGREPEGLARAAD
ncbi:MAG: ABC transporter permease, partial [Actinomycetota bacterium]|nr:ABC transporter permease [Actinomycetota bacterium]